MQMNRIVRVTVKKPGRKVNHLCKVVWDIYKKIIAEFTRSIGQTVLMMDVKASKNKYISKQVDWENITSVRRNSIKNRLRKRRWWLIEENLEKHQMKWSQFKTQIRIFGVL